MFGDYSTAGKLQAPQTWTNRASPATCRRRVQGAGEFNPAVTDQSFDVRGRGLHEGRAAADKLPKSTVEKLADGVFVIQNVAGQNQNTIAIEFKDYIFAVEAPVSSDGADNVIKRIKEAIPGKPIRYVAVTHHHSDHIGGLRSFIAEGATIVTTQGNRKSSK